MQVCIAAYSKQQLWGALTARLRLSPIGVLAWPIGKFCREGRNMTLIGLIIFLVIGAVAGWIAGQIMSGGGFGLVGNIVVGVIGSLIGGWLFNLFGVAIGGLIGSIVGAVIGAIVLLALLRLIRRA